MSQDKDILVLDSLEIHSSSFQNIILWKSFEHRDYPDAVSIPKIVKDYQDVLKKRYLKMVYSFGTIKIDGISVVDQLQLRDGFNYWWLTLINEKCNYSKSVWINDAIYLLAFDEWAKNKEINNIKLVSTNESLASCFRIFCDQRGIQFSQDKPKTVTTQEAILGRVFKQLPNPLKGLAWLLRYITKNWSLISVGLEGWKSTRGSITFISYLFNLDPKSEKIGYYKSEYWANLPEILNQKGVLVNWLHIYVEDNVLPTSENAAEAILRFNQQKNSKQKHIALTSFINWHILKKSFKDWYRLMIVGRKLKRIEFNNLKENFFLLPFVQIDLNESFYGITAIKNIMYFNLFERAFSLIRNQKKGIYLQENQGWEFALIQAWKKRKHETLIGVPHTTIRYWDLRYYFDKRSYQNNLNQMPKPDRVAVNGKLSRGMHIEGDYPSDELINVEALRFLYLKTISVRRTNSSAKKISKTRILVLGDYLHDNTNVQMQILVESFSFLKKNISLIIKPHPACPIIFENYPNLKMEVTNDPISKLLERCDAVYTSSGTSAAIDAYCANIPIISVLNPQTLNLSPLLDMKGIQFVYNSNQFIDSIENLKDETIYAFNQKDIFWLDTKLSMWKSVLNSTYTN